VNSFDVESLVVATKKSHLMRRTRGRKEDRPDSLSLKLNAVGQLEAAADFE
jgi:hypothetical protein